MAKETAPGQEQVPDYIENFVADEFIRVSQWFLPHYRLASHHDCVLEAAAADQSLVEQLFDIFVKNKGARPGDLFFVNLRSNFGGVKLGEAPFGSDLGARNPEFAIWNNRQQRSGL